MEFCILSSVTLNDRTTLTKQELNTKTGYNDYTIEAVNYLHSIDKDFYRINKSFPSGPAQHASLNDAKIQNFKGTPSYSSYNQLHYVKFLQTLDIAKNEEDTRWSHGLVSRPLLQRFASIRYSLTRNRKNDFPARGYSFIREFNDVLLYKDMYYLPFGYTYNSYILRSDFEKLPTYQKEISLFKSFVIDDQNEQKLNQQFEKKNIKDTIPSDAYTNVHHIEDLNNLRKGALAISKHSQNTIKGTIHVEEKKLLFFSIPYDKGWNAIVNGKETALMKVNVGFMGLLLEKGTHTVELNYRPPYLLPGLIVTLISIVIYLTLLTIERRSMNQPIISETKQK